MVKVIWHKAASPPHMDRSVVFARWRQCAPHINPKMVAMATSLSTAGPPSNTWLLGRIGAHKPNSISVGSHVFGQGTAACPYTLQWDALPPQNSPFPRGDLDPHIICGSVRMPESSTQITDVWRIELHLEEGQWWPWVILGSCFFCAVMQHMTRF